VLPGSATLLDGGRALHAVLEDRDGAADGATFNLTLRAYRGPVVRVLVDEYPAPPPPPAADGTEAKGGPTAGEKKEEGGEAGGGEGGGEADADADAGADEPAADADEPAGLLSAAARRRLPRYQLRDVLEPGLEAGAAVAWASASATKHTWTGVVPVSEAGGDQATVRVTFDPFKVELFVGPATDADDDDEKRRAASADGAAASPLPPFAPSVVINGRGMFHVERTRREGKADGDPDGAWEESFNGHRDSKPRGPQAISLDLTFPGAKHAYGLPERAASLALRPTAAASPLDRPAAGSAYSEPYRLYNLDVFEYLDDSPFGLYGSIPYLMAHRAEAAAAAGGPAAAARGGLLGGVAAGKKRAAAGGGGAPASSRPSTTVGAAWINAAEQYVDLSLAKDGTLAQWIAESGVLDLFLLAGPSPAAVAKQLASVAGATAMPQEFALGYHQCRWNYKDEADVAAVDGGFDAHAIPYDVLWLDIEHTDGKR